MSIRVNLGVRLLIGLAIAVLLLASAPAVWTRAAELPPRPPVPTVEPPDEEEPEVGAWIELRVSGAPAGAWTEVQWQDTAGAWHPVEGWRGELENGKKVWWVAPGDLRKGPFRWVIFQSASGEQVAAGAPFSLPQGEGQTVVVEVTIAP